MYRIIFFFILLASSNTYAVEFTGNGFGDIPDSQGICGVDGEPLEITFDVYGIINPITSLKVATEIVHTSIDNLTAIIEAPSGEQHVLFGKTGAVNSCTGYGTELGLGNVYSFSDNPPPNSDHWWDAALFAQNDILDSGTFKTTESGGINQNTNPAPETSLNDFVESVGEINGQWKLIFIDDQVGNLGYVEDASLSFGVDLSGQISDGNATYEIDSLGTRFNFSVNGNEYLGTSKWFFRTSAGMQEDSLGLPVSAVYDGQKATLRWVDSESGSEFAQVVYEIESTGNTSALLKTTLYLTNPTVSPDTISVYQLLNLDILTPLSDEFSLAQDPNVIHFNDSVEQQYFGAYAAGGNDAYQAATNGSIASILNDDQVDDLQNTGLPFGPGDGEFSVQWGVGQNQILVLSGQSLKIQTNLAVGDTDVPIPDDPLAFFDLIFENGFQQ